MVAALDIRGRWSHPVRDLVREGYEELCRQLSDDGRQLPDFVEREVSDYLACGDPEQGFAWLTCDACDTHRLIPFSCKRETFCSSCGSRRTEPVKPMRHCGVD